MQQTPALGSIVELTSGEIVRVSSFQGGGGFGGPVLNAAQLGRGQNFVTVSVSAIRRQLPQPEFAAEDEQPPGSLVPRTFLEARAAGPVGATVALIPSDSIEAGADLRDGGAGVNIAGPFAGDPLDVSASLVPLPGGGGLPPVLPAGPLAVLGVTALVARMSGPIAVASRSWFSTAAAGSRIGWATLPGWLRTALVSVGATAGAVLVMDEGTGVPFIDIPGFGGQNGHVGPHLEHLGAHVIGQWVANGIVFYRLSDGKIAVQNKHGRWKVWRPKKPVVLMPGGASNLRTLLRADAIVNRQTKKLAKMIQRRAPRTKKAAAVGPGRPIAAINGKIIDI